jgi:hypothetical protein
MSLSLSLSLSSVTSRQFVIFRARNEFLRGEKERRGNNGLTVGARLMALKVRTWVNYSVAVKTTYLYAFVIVFGWSSGPGMKGERGNEIIALSN